MNLINNILINNILISIDTVKQNDLGIADKGNADGESPLLSAG